MMLGAQKVAEVLRRRTLGGAQRHSVAAGVQMAARELQFAPDLVIFDKDGTLIDFKFMWGKWAEKLCSRLESQGHLNGEAMQLFTEALGYNRGACTVSNRSPLCCSPMHEIEDICVDFVSSHLGSSRRDEAVQAIRTAWHMPNPETDTRALTDLHDLFSFLRNERGSKIAVCTTDDRDVTEATLSWLKVDHLVDAVVCGDDAHLPPKPDPEQILYICDKLNVDPRNTVMVGDTITDMSMGHAAQVGLRIGIPNGAGTVEDLSHHADFILPSMNNFKRVFQQLTLPAKR